MSNYEAWNINGKILSVYAIPTLPNFSANETIVYSKFRGLLSIQN